MAALICPAPLCLSIGARRGPLKRKIHATRKTREATAVALRAAHNDDLEGSKPASEQPKLTTAPIPAPVLEAAVELLFRLRTERKDGSLSSRTTKDGLPEASDIITTTTVSGNGSAVSSSSQLIPKKTKKKTRSVVVRKPMPLHAPTSDGKDNVMNWMTALPQNIRRAFASFFNSPDSAPEQPKQEQSEKTSDALTLPAEREMLLVSTTLMYAQLITATSPSADLNGTFYIRAGGQNGSRNNRLPGQQRPKRTSLSSVEKEPTLHPQPRELEAGDQLQMMSSPEDSTVLGAWDSGSYPMKLEGLLKQQQLLFQSFAKDMTESTLSDSTNLKASISDEALPSGGESFSSFQQTDAQDQDHQGKAAQTNWLDMELSEGGVSIDPSVSNTLDSGLHAGIPQDGWVGVRLKAKTRQDLLNCLDDLVGLLQQDPTLLKEVENALGSMSTKLFIVTTLLGVTTAAALQDAAKRAWSKRSAKLLLHRIQSVQAREGIIKLHRGDSKPSGKAERAKTYCLSTILAMNEDNFKAFLEKL